MKKAYTCVDKFIPVLPLHMVWLVTNKCNAQCEHCSSNSLSPYPDELSTEEAHNLIEQLAEAGVIDIAISGGEPLLRKDIFELIEHIKALNISVGIGTNGSPLKHKYARKLKQIGIDRVQVSLDGLKEQHDKLRNWDGLYDKALESINIASEIGLKVHVCCTITTINWNSLDEYVELVSTLPVSRINFSRFVPTGRGTDKLDLTQDCWRKTIMKCAELKGKYKDIINIVGHHAQEVLFDHSLLHLNSFSGCQAGITQGAISSTGEIYPCVLLPVSIGNLKKEPFQELWKKSATIESLHNRANLLGDCGFCGYKNHCGGCRAVAYAKTGNIFETDPRCWLPRDDLSFGLNIDSQTRGN